MPMNVRPQAHRARFMRYSAIDYFRDNISQIKCPEPRANSVGFKNCHGRDPREITLSESQRTVPICQTLERRIKHTLRIVSAICNAAWDIPLRVILILIVVIVVVETVFEECSIRTDPSRF